MRSIWSLATRQTFSVRPIVRFRELIGYLYWYNTEYCQSGVLQWGSIHGRKSALLHAIEKDLPDVVFLLLEKGEDIESRDYEGVTPLMHTV